jgi:activator of HSP90 ATPase
MEARYNRRDKIVNDSFCISKVIHAKPEVVFSSWLDSAAHTAFTGAKAVIDPNEGGTFTAWDGYISGKTVLIEANKRIVQLWRTTDFAQDDPDSNLELLFAPSKSGTKLTICHSNLPEGQGDNYKNGWIDFYFTPMNQYFRNNNKQR